MKSLSNKFFMKKQLNNLRVKEGTPILQHLNAFNRILNDLLALEVKLAEEEKALLLLSSLSSSYDHLATTIMNGKETLKLEDVRQMLQDKLMKKIDSIEETSGLVIKGQREDQRVRDPKRIQRLIEILLATIARNQDTSRRNI